MKKMISLVIVVVLVAGVTCKEKDQGHHSNSGHGDSGSHHEKKATMYKIVKLDKMQVTMELMTMDKHMKMMKAMKMKMDHAKGSNHALSISLLDKKTMKPVKGAKIKATMTCGDSKKSKPANIMEGAGMYHYGANFSLKEVGDCKSSLEISLGGKKYTADATFDMDSMKHGESKGHDGGDHH